MPRPRIRPPASECVRLRPTDLIKACGSEYREVLEPVLLGLPGPVDLEPYPVVAVSLGEDDYERVTFGLAFWPPGLDDVAEPASQVLTAKPERDSRGRRRYYFQCREPGGLRPAEVVYLPPGGDRFLSRYCLQVSFRLFPPEPLGYEPPWDPIAGFLVADCRTLARAAEQLLAEFPGSRAQEEARLALGRRSSRGVRAARRRWLSLRQRAVGHLWGMCGWEPEELAALFKVGERSIQRDLGRARALGDAPRRRTKHLAPQLVAEARKLLAQCQALRAVVYRAPRDLLLDADQTVWAHGICARLLKDEVRLAKLLTQLGAGQPVTLPYSCRPTQLDGLQEPQLMATARAFIAGVMS